MNNLARKSTGSLLRHKAEELLNLQLASTSQPRSDSEMMRLIQELEVHQIELEMQNDALLEAESAAQENANRYIELYDFAPSGYVSLTANGEIQKLNLACARMLGKQRSFLIRRRFSNYISQETRPIYKAFFQQVFYQKIPRSCDVTISSDGSSPLHVHLSGILAGDDNLLLLTVTDITERLEMEQLLRDVQRREAIGVLSSGIAHDFNNHLAVMMGNVSLALVHLPPRHPARINMQQALSAMETAAELTRQMLAYSGKGKNQILTIDLGAEIKQHVSLFEVSISKNVKLVTQFPPSPLYVNGDPGQIKQVIMNLIMNGADAIGVKQGVVTVSLSEAELKREDLSRYERFTGIRLNEGRYTLLDVHDNGIGMNGEIINEIFDPFFTTKFIGRGLGLSAVLGIIRGHDGGIAIDSIEGSGSTFHIILPAVAAPEIKNIPQTESPRIPSLQAKSVLVIDDEHDVAMVAREILKMENYTVLVEQHPMRGIECYREHQSEIGVVLLDLTMPEMSGKDVIDRLQAINPDVKIIVSSGYSEMEMHKTISAERVTGFIQKPYPMESLLALVHRSIE
jgi:PAS domain S-box-containing protein